MAAPKIMVTFKEPPRRRNKMFQFLGDIPMWLWIAFFSGCAALLVLDYIQ